MSLRKQKIGIVGIGPVGSILASILLKTDLEVILVDNGARCKQIKEHGINISGYKNINESVKPPIVLSSVQNLKDYDLDALFICTKAYALKFLLSDLKDCVGSKTLIISFQNGIEPENEILNAFPKNDVARGVVNYAGGIDQKTGNVTWTWFTPPNYIGSINSQNEGFLTTLVDYLIKHGLTTESVSNFEIKKKTFFKTIMNASLFPLCAILSMTMREATSSSCIRPIVKKIIDEGLNVAKEFKYEYGPNMIETCMSYLEKGGDHYPSMWKDLNEGLPTEIDYVNGKITEIGLEKGVDVSNNLLLTSMIVAQEIKSGTREKENIPAFLKDVL